LYINDVPSRRAPRSLVLILGALLCSLIACASSRAAEAEGNPNDYQCRGHVQAAPVSPEAQSTENESAEKEAPETQVQYVFACNGPITGYQLQTRQQLTGFDAAPLVTYATGAPVLTAQFSCSGESPGLAVNCVGASTLGWEMISGKFAIGTKLCAEPRVDPVLTVTDASSSKTGIAQAISGPFDLGRPHGCPASAARSHKGTKKHAKKGIKGRKGVAGHKK
jgi:hypothetical protein